jgi:hypothetical protein
MAEEPAEADATPESTERAETSEQESAKPAVDPFKQEVKSLYKEALGKSRTKKPESKDREHGFLRGLGRRSRAERAP